MIGRLSADADNRPMPIVKWPIPIIGKLAGNRPIIGAHGAPLIPSGGIYRVGLLVGICIMMLIVYVLWLCKKSTIMSIYVFKENLCHGRLPHSCSTWAKSINSFCHQLFNTVYNNYSLMLTRRATASVCHLVNQCTSYNNINTFWRGYLNLMTLYGGFLEPRGFQLRLLKSTFSAENFVGRLSSQWFWRSSLLKCASQPEIMENSVKLPVLWVQGRSRSSMLVPLKSLSAVLVMTSSKSVSICNRSYAR